MRRYRSLEDRHDCPICEGSGDGYENTGSDFRPHYELVRCGHCGGSGRFDKRIPKAPGVNPKKVMRDVIKTIDEYQLKQGRWF